MALYAGAYQYTASIYYTKVSFIVICNITNAVNKAGRLVAAIAPWFRLICHLAAPGLNPKRTIYAL